MGSSRGKEGVSLSLSLGLGHTDGVLSLCGCRQEAVEVWQCFPVLCGYDHGVNSLPQRADGRGVTGDGL